MNECGPDLVFT